MKLAIVGCGYVVDFYLKTLPNYPHLRVLGVMDREPGRSKAVSKYYGLPTYTNLDEILRDDRVQVVLNLTNPRNHYEVSKRCLEAGKHVYSEKPLSTDYAQAEELVHSAKQRGLQLTSAPCSVLGEAAQTAWRAIRRNAIGKVRLAHAELDDGLIHRMNYRSWRSDSGNPWPWKDEFEVGCTLEHGGYYVTWLVAFFGPAKSVTSFASCQIPDKETDVPITDMTPDFTVACIEFQAGIVARITCSIVAPRNHELKVYGDEGILTVRDCWDYESPVYIQRCTRRTVGLEKSKLLAAIPGVMASKQPLAKGPKWPHRYSAIHGHQMDFSRGVAEVAAAITEKRECRLSTSFALHVNEIVLAIQYPQTMGCPRKLTSTCEPMQPVPWAGS